MRIKFEETPELLASFDVMDFIKTDESLTLSVGNELLDKFYGDAKKAIEHYPVHAAEISLSSITKKMNEMKLTAEVEALFNHVLDLIQVS